ncbi:alpha/beta hydrolase fold-domain-containing protein [Coniochaeta sp. 2T2.1]|nr:alpha/beta hydrolase fold-domain-containing protein [Coniochaeta sp. 2T2.1]
MELTTLQPPPWVKPQSSYTNNQPTPPGPRHGHWSDRTPNAAFEQAEQEAERLNLQAWGYGRNGTLAEFKNALQKLPALVSPDSPRLGEDVVSNILTAPARDGTPIELRVYRSTRAATTLATLAFKIHGGGWVVGDSSVEELENRWLGAQPDVVVASVHYRMAPEFPFPTPLNDCWDMLNWCKSNHQDLGIDPEKVVLLGCSAGGNLAAALAIMARDAGLTGIIGQHLSIPVTCHPKFFNEAHSIHGPMELLSWQQNRNAALVDAVRMETFWDLYVGTEPEPDPLHSPLLCPDLKGLPQAMVQVAGYDPLRDEGIEYAEALKAAGVKVVSHVYKGLPHGFYNFLVLEEAHLYYRRVVDFVRRCAKRVEL